MIQLRFRGFGNENARRPGEFPHQSWASPGILGIAAGLASDAGIDGEDARNAGSAREAAVGVVARLIDQPGEVVDMDGAVAFEGEQPLAPEA